MAAGGAGYAFPIGIDLNRSTLVNFGPRIATARGPAFGAGAEAILWIDDPGWRPLRVELDLVRPAEGSAADLELRIDRRSVRVAPGAIGATPVGTTISDVGDSRVLGVRVRGTPPGPGAALVGIRSGQLRWEVISIRALPALLCYAITGALLSGLAPARSRSRSASLVAAGLGAVLGVIVTRSTMWPASAVLAAAAAFRVIRRLAEMPPAAIWLAAIAPAFPAFASPGTGAAVNALWFGFVVIVLSVLGRLARSRMEEHAGVLPGGCRSPVFDLALGILLAGTLLGTYSFVIKRLGVPPPGRHGFVAVLLVAMVVMALNPRDGRRRLEYPPIERVELLLFLLGLGVLALPHWGSAAAGYTNDPQLHAGWLNQIRLHGYVPDTYAGTRLPIEYPLGFHALAFPFVALAPLAEGTVITLVRALTNALFIYVVVTLVVQRFGEGGSLRAMPLVGRMLLWLTLALAVNSTQYGVWAGLESTTRLAAGLAQIVPIVLFYAATSRRPAGSRVAPAASAFGVLLLVVAAAFAFLLNPVLLWLQGLLSVVTIGASGRRAWRSPAFWKGAFAGTAVSGLVAFAILANDPYTIRPYAQIAGVSFEPTYITSGEFYERLTGKTCLSLACIGAAASSASVWTALPFPVLAFVLGPIVQGLTRVGWTGWAASPPLAWIPDITGFDHAYAGTLAPFHGTSFVVFSVAAPVFLLLAWRARAGGALALVASVLILAGIDASFRVFMTRLVDSRDSFIRLIPFYDGQAAAVLFNQLLWTLVVSWLAGLAWTRRGTGRVPATIASTILVAVLGGLAITSFRSMLALNEGHASMAASWGRDLIQDFRELEARVVPSGEAYLVDAVQQFNYDEKWLMHRDPAAHFYFQSDRPALFLEFLSHGAAYGPADLTRTCEELAAGRPPEVIRKHRARWMAVRSSPVRSADEELALRWFCRRPIRQVFPSVTAVARRGEVTIYRLW